MALAWLLTQSVAALILLAKVLVPLWLPILVQRATERVVGPARTARARLRARRHHRLLSRLWPEVARSTGLSSSWRVLDILPTVGDVAVATVGADAPSAVIKVALSESGTTALLTANEATERLLADHRLSGWTTLLPHTVTTTRAPDGRLVVVERFIPGIDGRRAISECTCPAVEAVLDAVGQLHQRTGSVQVIGDGLLRHWVDDPIEVLSSVAGAEESAVLRALGVRLRSALGGRAMTVGWIHGDLAPGNVRFSPDLRQVTGLLDWERARPDGLAAVDVAHFRLTLRMHTQKSELGDLVCEALRGNETPVLDDDALLLVTWLHHVSGIVAKTGSYSARSVWWARNVQPVLEHLQGTAV